jgi:hypothetical protein
MHTATRDLHRIVSVEDELETESAWIIANLIAAPEAEHLGVCCVGLSRSFK